jgi:predicted transcriptional regulator of viral defense system
MLNAMKEKTIQSPFSIDEVVNERGISRESARGYCVRKARSGEYIRLKNNLYILRSDWNVMNWEERLKLANRIQVPSYISLLTALAYYELTTQIPISRIESIAVTKTYFKDIEDYQFIYTKINRKLYRGFTKQNGLFIASPEKALADCIYLCSFGKYALDFFALDAERINSISLNTWLSQCPVKTQTWWEKYGNI